MLHAETRADFDILYVFDSQEGACGVKIGSTGTRRMWQRRSQLRTVVGRRSARAAGEYVATFSLPRQAFVAEQIAHMEALEVSDEHCGEWYADLSVGDCVRLAEFTCSVVRSDDWIRQFAECSEWRQYRKLWREIRAEYVVPKLSRLPRSDRMTGESLTDEQSTIVRYWRDTVKYKSNADALEALRADHGIDLAPTTAHAKVREWTGSGRSGR